MAAAGYGQSHATHLALLPNYWYERAGPCGIGEMRGGKNSTMESVSRIAAVEDHETSDAVRARFGELIVAYFVRAIESLNGLPKGPELAVRKVWSESPELLEAETKAAWRDLAH
jgi:hypothetical protein